MLFNSIDFAIFLPVVFFLYWFVTQRNLKIQNLLLVVASYLFYGWWDWRFLTLIMFSSVVDYAVGLGLSRANNRARRKLLLWVSIIVNLGFLGFFKYYNFFIDNFIAAFAFFGVSLSKNTLNIILPVGISFYTFQTLSYSIDVYRKKIEPTKDFIAFCAFVSFFPQLVAGPIERATNLLPQFYKKRVFDYAAAVNGMRQILWGLFKKIVIADNCARYANIIFNNYHDYSGSTLLLGAFFFTFQIYGDFSGYSDIAIGTSSLFGFKLKRNFAYPYFSRDMAEFWRRWHISLSTWFRDYLYIPLGGSHCTILKKIRNLFLIFTVSGFWHGANWTFIAWGLFNAISFLPLLVLDKNRNNLDIVASGRVLPSFSELFRILRTFLLIVISWVFFRAETIGDAFIYIRNIFTLSLISAPGFRGDEEVQTTIFLIIAFIIVEWCGREHQHALSGMERVLPRTGRWVSYIVLILITYFYGNFSESIEFIYFQF
ncbi:putative poly(beta-D-mannuronate) O-acetylase [Desulfamplus magnetovallimortis]|uniref:Putative poly(Beta-D-mannuronate) O-acetylase n=1 Tax=Desulfamplus magnetovallimortis TaxID=1246637 RepID=A0A1W1HBU1_9BACT|nr:MBOAT family O-acyltransferase [Desulfamplus magnetovallimortis]SLM29971.1 putative poly(beta-D-mannuronate) O-acetylase [Desulfamplus magnetovallimortis]